MLRILTHNRPNSLQYYSSETIQVLAKKGLIHTLVHTLFSYTPNILLIDIHTFHIKQVSFCSTTGRGWPFLGASCHCTIWNKKATETAFNTTYTTALETKNRIYSYTLSASTSSTASTTWIYHKTNSTCHFSHTSRAACLYTSSPTYNQSTTLAEELAIAGSAHRPCVAACIEHATSVYHYRQPTLPHRDTVCIAGGLQYSSKTTRPALQCSHHLPQQFTITVQQRCHAFVAR